jgi:hypothetical protein
MSDHRLHYMDLQGAPARAQKEEAPQPPTWMLVVLALLVLAVQLLFAIFPPLPTVVVTPVRTPEAQAFEIPPVTPEEARIEGFRAGMATAAENGCAVYLTPPIATEH